MKLSDLIESGYQKMNDFNCAEAIVYGANEAYNLGLLKETLHFSVGFGGGMCTEKDCGIITGMVMILGHLYGEERGHQSPRMKEIIRQAIYEFETCYETTNCTALKEKYRDEVSGCHSLIVRGAKIIDQIYEKNACK